MVRQAIQGDAAAARKAKNPEKHRLSQHIRGQQKKALQAIAESLLKPELPVSPSRSFWKRPHGSLGWPLDPLSLRDGLRRSLGSSRPAWLGFTGGPLIRYNGSPARTFLKVTLSMAWVCFRVWAEAPFGEKSRRRRINGCRVCVQELLQRFLRPPWLLTSGPSHM